jgi:hypothetical protein
MLSLDDKYKAELRIKSFELAEKFISRAHSIDEYLIISDKIYNYCKEKEK